MMMTERELTGNLVAFARLLAKDEYLRREFMARLSCAMVQTGTHIDSMPVNNPPPPDGHAVGCEVTNCLTR